MLRIVDEPGRVLGALSQILGRVLGARQRSDVQQSARGKESRKMIARAAKTYRAFASAVSAALT